MATRLWLIAAVAAIVAVGAIGAIAVRLDGEGDPADVTGARGPAPAATDSSGAGFWDAVRIDGTDRLIAATLDDLRTQSDVAVLATVEGIRANRVVEGDAAEGRALFGVAALRVQRVVAGELDRPAEVVGVEFTVSGTYEESLARLRRAAADPPGGPVLAFLVSVDRELARQASAGRTPRALPEQAGLYIPHSSVGIFAATDRDAVDTPIGDRSRLAAELAGVPSIAALASRIAAAAGPGG